MGCLGCLGHRFLVANPHLQALNAAHNPFDLYQLLYIFYFLSNNNNTNNPKL